MFKRCFCLYWESYMLHSVQCPYLSWNYTQACSSQHQNVIRICFRLWFFSICQAQPKYQQIPRWHCYLHVLRGKTPFRTTLQFSWIMVWNIHSTSIIGSYFSNSDLNILVKQRFLKCEFAPCFHHKYLGWFFFQCNINCQMVKLVIKRSSGWETN